MSNRLEISELIDSQSIYTLPSCVHVTFIFIWLTVEIQGRTVRQ
jgi:hypothetical protein